MKMTKIESARIIVANNGRCFGLKEEVKAIECNRCFNGWNQDKCKDFTEDKILALAEAYIKRHEQKTKQKDHIEDKLDKVDTYHKKLEKDYTKLKPVEEKVTRPNFRKYLRDKIDMKVRVTPELSEELQKICFRENVFWTGGIKDIQSGKEFLFISNTSKYIKSYNIKSESTELLFSQHIECKEYNPKTDTLVEKVEEPKQEPTPLQIAKMIRDNGYSCSKILLSVCQTSCPFNVNPRTCSCDIEDATNSELCDKTVVDDYISQHEPCDKDCPANSEYPHPVKFEDEVPEYVYIVTNNAVLRREVVQFVHQRYKTQKPDMFILTVGGSTMSFEECYRTPEEALQVAKKLWNGDGK